MRRTEQKKTYNLLFTSVFFYIISENRQEKERKSLEMKQQK